MDTAWAKCQKPWGGVIIGCTKVFFREVGCGSKWETMKKKIAVHAVLKDVEDLHKHTELLSEDVCHSLCHKFIKSMSNAVIPNALREMALNIVFSLFQMTRSSNSAEFLSSVLNLLDVKKKL